MLGNILNSNYMLGTLYNIHCVIDVQIANWNTRHMYRYILFYSFVFFCYVTNL